MSTRAAQQVHAELDQLAGEYLATCHPVDLSNIDFSSYTTLSEGLTLDGMDRASDVRRRVLDRLPRVTYEGADLVARDQLLDWVSSDHELMESGEKFRRLLQTESPHHRIAQAIRITLATKPVDWDAVCQGLESVAACLRQLPESLRIGLEHGVVATRSEAELARGRYAAMNGQPADWLGATLSLGGEISLSQETQVLAAAQEVATGAEDLTKFLDQHYLPGTSDQMGIGRERYSLWAHRLLGEEIDLGELYASMWDELRESQSQLEEVAAGISPEGSVRDLIWQLGSSVDGDVDVIEDLPNWILHTARTEALAVDAELVQLPVGAMDFALADGGRELTDVMEVHPPKLGGGRQGIVLLRTLNNFRLPVWPLSPLLHLQIFPGEHLFNCFLNDSRTPLRRFQCVLVNHLAISGWMSHSMMLAGFEIEPDDDLRKLNAIRNRLRELVCALGDIGSNLGLTIPDVAPDFAGEQWTEEIHTQAIAQWAHQQRQFAKVRVSQCAMNPGYALGPIVGSRIRDEALRQARMTAGKSFDIRAYHDKVLRLAPTGAVGLRAQLAGVVADL